jgi:hypothetical protein
VQSRRPLLRSLQTTSLGALAITGRNVVALRLTAM